MPAMLSTATRTRTRPSAGVAVPADVVDIMLWRLAFDVAVEHQPGPAGACTNLRCIGHPGPCEPFQQANQALRAARRPAGRPPATITGTAQTKPPSRRAGPVPTGRAAVNPTPNIGRFTGWFTHTATTTNRLRDRHLPRRAPGAALAAA